MERFKISDMKSLIIIQTETKTDDGMGGFTTTVTNKCKVWADIKAMSSHRQLLYSQVIDGVPYDIRTRATDNLTIDSKILLSSTQLTIHSIKENINWPEFIDIIAFEKR